MAIEFDQIPSNIRLPGVFAEVVPGRAVRGVGEFPLKVLVIGQKLATGTATAAVPVQVFNAAHAVGLFGQHSQLARMFAALKRVDPFTPTYAIPLADAGSGVAATGTVTFSGTVTQAGTLNLYIGGRRVRVAVAAAEANATTATNVAAAITAHTDMPVTASASGAVVTLTSRNKGEVGNAIDVRANYWPGDALPAGLAVAIVAMASGSGNPDMGDAIAAMSSEWWTDLIVGWTDAANMTALDTELATRFGPMVDLQAFAYTAVAASNAGAITWGNARNSPYVFPIAAYRLPTPPDEWAAVVGILSARDFASDPARPMTGVALPGILPPAVADRFDPAEMNLLLFEGISDWTVDADGTVRLSRLVTAYQTNAYGAADDAWLDATTPHTVRRVRHTLTNYVQANHARQKIADDGTRFGAGQNVATPSAIKGTIAAAYMALEAAGLIEDVKAALANTLVERDANDQTRVNVLTPPNLVNPLYVIAIKLQFSL